MCAMSSPRARRALAALLSLSLLSAACSDDGGTETSLGDGSTTTSTTSSPANDSTAAPTDDVEVDDQVEGHADNFDSARGVPAGTINIDHSDGGPFARSQQRRRTPQPRARPGHKARLSCQKTFVSRR